MDDDEQTTEETVEPTTDGPHPEAVGSGGRTYVWECSEGDYLSRTETAEQDVLDHIASEHGDAPKAKRKR